MLSIVRFLKNDDAATAVEYAVMLALILLTAISAISLFGTKTNELFGTIVSSEQGAGM